MMDTRYQLIHGPPHDVYQTQGMRHGFLPQAQAGGMMSPHHRGVAPAGSHPDPAAAVSQQQGIGSSQQPGVIGHGVTGPPVLSNNMQSPQPSVRGPFRLPGQPCGSPMSIRSGSQAPLMTYGPPRPMPQMMMQSSEMQQQQLQQRMQGPGFEQHVLQSSPRARAPGEQPLLLEDLLEQVLVWFLYFLR